MNRPDEIRHLGVARSVEGAPIAIGHRKRSTAQRAQHTRYLPTACEQICNPARSPTFPFAEGKVVYSVKFKVVRSVEPRQGAIFGEIRGIWPENKVDLFIVFKINRLRPGIDCSD